MITAPADGPVAWTTHDDLAAADAALLAGEQVIEGPTPPMTGPEALDLAAIARLVSEVKGTPVARSLIGLSDLDLQAGQRGASAGVREFMLGYFRAAQAGEFAKVDPMLATLIGRQVTRMRDFLVQHLTS